MSDIVELMRSGRVCDDKCRVMEAKSGCLCAEAADEIERLRAALELFACDCIESGNLCPSPHACRNYVARAALEEGRT